MGQLIGKSGFLVPLLMGIGVLCFGTIQADNQLPGRDVDSNEAGAVLGTGCGNYASVLCSCGNSKYKAKAGTSKNTSESGGGCETNCSCDKYSVGCSGG